MSDLAIEFRVKNGRLKRAILAKWESYAAFCRANHIKVHVLSDLLGMRKPAMRSDGWREAAVDIATALHVEPEELWPDEMRRAALSRNSGEFELTLEDAAKLTAPNVNRMAFAQLTQGLSSGELKAVTALARGETFGAAGMGGGVTGGDISGTRARQLSLKAIRKMAHRARQAGLTMKDVIEP